MAKFLEDIYGKRFWTETPEDWDAVFLAAKEAGVPMVGEAARHRKYRELECREGKWGGNMYQANAPYSITTQDVLAVLRIEKLCKEKPGLKEAIKKAEGLGIRPGVEVEWIGYECRSGPFIVPPYEEWSVISSGCYWSETFHGAPSEYCWIVGSDGCDYYNAKPTGNGYLIFNGTSDVAAVVSVEDNEIRVGDTVQRINESHYGMVVGDRATVIRILGNGISLVEYGGGGVTHDRKNLKKVTNAGGRSSTTNNQTHGQVQGTSEQDSGRTEGRTAQRPDAGRQGATGSGHPGQRASQPPSRFRGAKGTLRFTI